MQWFNVSYLLDSYCGAQIFEIYGLGQEVVDLAFCGSVSKIGGLTLDEVIYIFSVHHIVAEFVNAYLIYFFWC
jgi:glutamate synthase domain-containing protein 2